MKFMIDYLVKMMMMIDNVKSSSFILLNDIIINIKDIQIIKRNDIKIVIKIRNHQDFITFSFPDEDVAKSSFVQIWNKLIK